MPNISRDDRNKSKWMIRWREIDESGVEHQRKKRGFDTKKAAESWIYNYKKETERPVAKEPDKVPPANPEDMMFDELAEEWLAYQKNRVKESSYYSIANRVRVALIPAFDKMRLRDIRPLDILRWQESLIGKYSYAYRNNLFERLGAIYRYGVKYHDIVNVVAKVDKPRNTEPPKKMSFWTPEQFSAFIDAIEDDDYRLFFRLLYTLGCRRGELQALQWRDFDPAAPSVHICHTITLKTLSGAWAMTTPKTLGSDRIIKISPRMAEELSERRMRVSGIDDDFVFGGKHPYAEQTINRRFEDATKKAGLPKIRVHDLRHSCASYLISQGVDIVTVSARLGHSSVKQTLDTYSHMMPKAEDRAADLMDRF